MYRKRGQSILEYVIVLTVIVVGIAFAATKFIRPATEAGFEDAEKTMEDATGRLPGATPAPAP